VAPRRLRRRSRRLPPAAGAAAATAGEARKAEERLSVGTPRVTMEGSGKREEKGQEKGELRLSVR